MITIFVTGIGTDVGKTVVSAIIAEALQADYWKPVQAGFEQGTDSDAVKDLLTNQKSVIHPSFYTFRLPASPHIAARVENVRIDLEKIVEEYERINTGNEWLIVEGAGGLMVPLNEEKFAADLIMKMRARVVIVSRNYLGSINHSLLTSKLLNQMGIVNAGWVFNDHFMDYEDEITHWSGYPKIGSIPFTDKPDARFVHEQAQSLKTDLTRWL